MGFTKREEKKKEFEPTTPEQLERIEKNGRRKRKLEKKQDEADKEARKAERDKDKRFPRQVDAMRDALLKNQPVKVFKPQFFRMFLEHCKETGEKPPAYRAYKDVTVADGDFMFEVQQCTARMSWTQLGQLISTGMGKPIPTRDFSEAFHCVIQMFVHAFDVREGKRGIQVIKNRDVLDEWPVPEKLRRSKEEVKMSKMERRNAAMKAKSDEDEDEDDDAEEEDDVEDDEDDEPKSKKKGFGKKAKKEKLVKKGKKEKPARVKAVDITDRTVIAKAKPRDKGGPKTKVLELVPRKGISIKDLTAAAKKAELPHTRVKLWAKLYVKYGYAKVI